MEIKTIGEIVGANTESKQYTEADVYAIKSLRPNQEVRGKMNENGVVYRKVVYWTMLKDSPYTRCPICLKMSHGQTVSILRYERHKYASQIDGNEFKIGYEDWYDFAIRSCGKPVDGMEVRIDSTDPQNVAGEIQVCGDNVMLGYYKQPDVTAATFTDDGYMKTGDLGVMDKYGNIYIKGSSKNMILTANGQNVYPEEIEELLNAMPHVRESIIISRKNRIIAIVATENDDSNPLTKS